MYETEEQTQVQTDRSHPLFDFSRRSSDTTVLPNQMDFSSTVSSPDYSFPSTRPTDTTEEQTPSYEVEKEYNIDAVDEDKVVVPTFMPTIMKKEEPATEVNANAKIKLNARGKIIASVFGVVVCLLMVFMIYNAVVISSLSAKLAGLEAYQGQSQIKITALESDYSDITSVKHMEMVAGDNGFSKNVQSKTITLQPQPEIAEAKVTGNWFDSLCEWLSELFN